MAYVQDQQIYFKKDEDAFLFSNFVIISLCNSSVNSWLNIFSLLTAPPEVLELVDFLSKRFINH